MYGLLLDSIQKFLREKYGEHYWVVIRRRAKLTNHWFVTHEVYSDSVMSDLVNAAAATLGEDRDHVMKMFGEYFVQTIGRYGYARLLRILGRDMRDFLNGLDDLHEYLRFSYPKMRPPSFFCEGETPGGVVMHYTTSRRGYLSYVIGQLNAVGRIYGKDLNISILKENYTDEGCHVILDLQFDNREFVISRRNSISVENLQINGETFISIFPFSLAFNKKMEVILVGPKIEEVLPGLKGRRLDYAFTHRRPRHVLLRWESIVMHTNCSFELISVDKVTRPSKLGMGGTNSPSMRYNEPSPTLKLKGQMFMMNSGEHIFFLCSPV
jgi:guanylate cyclase